MNSNHTTLVQAPDTTLPERAKAIKLQPINTDLDCESLTSYITRLSNKHFVSPRDLIKSVYIPEIAGSDVNNHNHFYTKTPSTINGIGKYAHAFVKATESITNRRKLSHNTMLPWAKLVAPKAQGLFGSQLRWCPYCYREQYITHNTNFERLEWNLRTFKACPIHENELVEKCPNCNCRRTVFTGNSEPGFCAHCGHWLGKIDSYDELQPGLNGHVASAKAIAAYLLEARQNPRILNLENFQQGLKICCEKYAEGSIRKFADEILKLDHSTVYQWIISRNRPQFNMVIYILQRLGVSVKQFFTGDIPNLWQPSHFAKPPARRKYKDIAVLRYEHTKLELDALLLDDTKAHVSLGAFANSIGSSEGYIKYHFYEKAKLVSKRYTDHTYRKAEALKEHRKKLVRDIVHSVHEQGLYPSVNRCSTFLKNKGMFKNQVIRDSYDETLRELGYK